MATIDDLPDSLRDEYDAMSPDEQAAMLERLDLFPGIKEQLAREETEQAAEQEARANLGGAIVTLRQWAADARGTTVTSGNAVATLQVVVNRLGIFFDRFADLLVTQRQGGNPTPPAGN